jgi:AcrR family transcriptional regulator
VVPARRQESGDTARSGASDRPATGTELASKATKGERTRQRLLDLAVERFGAQGYRTTSVSEIARAAGLTQAAAYAYFPSKEALFDAAVDADAGALVAEAEAEAAGTPIGQLVPLLVVCFLGGLDRHPLTRRVVGGLEPDALQRLVNLPALGRLTGDIADAVRSAQSRGEVRADLDAELFANGAEAIVVSLVMSVTQVGASTESRRQMGVLSIFDAVLRPPAIT